MSRRELALVTVVGALCAGSLKADDVYGDFYNASGKTVMVAGSQDLNVWGSIRNFGTMIIVPARSAWAEVEFQNSGVVELTGATCSGEQCFTNNATGVVKGFGLLASPSGRIKNQGLIWSIGGSLTLAIADTTGAGISNTGTLRNGPGTSLTSFFWRSPASPVADVNNRGTIEVNANGAVVFDCNLINEPNATVRLFGGTLAAKTVTQEAGAILEGFGGVTGNLVIAPNAVVKLTGPSNIVGDVKISEGATLEASDGTTLITGNVSGNGTIRLKGAKIIAQHGLSSDCRIVSEPSTSTTIGDK